MKKFNSLAELAEAPKEMSDAYRDLAFDWELSAKFTDVFGGYWCLVETEADMELVVKNIPYNTVGWINDYLMVVKEYCKPPETSCYFIPTTLAKLLIAKSK